MRRLALITPPLVVVLAVGAFAVVERHPIINYVRHGALTTPAAPAPPTVPPQFGPLPANAPTPTPTGLAAALGPMAANPALGTLGGVVSDPATGQVIWQSGADRPLTPASNTKDLTVAAALLALPTDHRVTTKVVQGAKPNELVLVGGGDPTLTAQPIGTPGFFPTAAHLDDLVGQIQHSPLAAQIDTILIDNSAYTGPTLAKGWVPADIAGGNIAPMEPVMIDAARIIPPNAPDSSLLFNGAAQDAPRSPTPSLDVGRLLAQRLGIDPAHVHLGTAPVGATQVAAVQSGPLRDWLAQLLPNSDNLAAEAVGRQLAIAEGLPASFAGATQAVHNILTRAGFDLTGVTLEDVDGMSTDNRVPANVLNAILMAAAGAPGTPPAIAAKLSPMLDALPIAGATGTLSDRFLVAATHGGAGWVRAKTGSLADVNTLAGYVVDSNGRVLTFAFMSNGTPGEVSRPALDALATALHGCGCS